MNQGTIIDTRSWYKIQLLNAFSRIRAKRKVLRRRKRVCVNFSSRLKSHKSFNYTDNSLEFGRSCEDPSWHHRTSTLHRSETNGIAERAVRRKKERQQYCCNLAWMQNGGQSLRNAIVICEIFKTSRQMRKTIQERRYGEPLEEPIIPFGTVVDYHPISSKDQSRLDQFGKKVLPGIFLGY